MAAEFDDDEMYDNTLVDDNNATPHTLWNAEKRKFVFTYFNYTIETIELLKTFNRVSLEPKNLEPKNFFYFFYYY